MKNSITDVLICASTPLFASYVKVFRKGWDYNTYSIKTLTRYQRAVRLLNAFVERNMK